MQPTALIELVAAPPPETPRAQQQRRGSGASGHSPWHTPKSRSVPNVLPPAVVTGADGGLVSAIFCEIVHQPGVLPVVGPSEVGLQ
jgi:hypothetical protein